MFCGCVISPSEGCHISMRFELYLLPTTFDHTQFMLFFWAQSQSSRFRIRASTQRTTGTQLTRPSRKHNTNYLIAPLILIRSPLLGTLFAHWTGDALGVPINLELADVVASWNLSLPTDIGTYWTDHCYPIMFYR